MLFIVKLNPEFLSLVLQKSQSNLELSLFFVSCEEKYNYRVVSAGRLSFDCCSYRGRSRRMQEICKRYANIE